MKESHIQRKIIQTIERLGGYCVNVVQAGKAGTPDIVCCVDGKFVGIEVKRPGFKARELQAHHLEKIREAGGVSFVAHSVSEALAFLGEVYGNG